MCYNAKTIAETFFFFRTPQFWSNKTAPTFLLSLPLSFSFHIYFVPLSHPLFVPKGLNPRDRLVLLFSSMYGVAFFRVRWKREIKWEGEKERVRSATKNGESFPPTQHYFPYSFSLSLSLSLSLSHTHTHSLTLSHTKHTHTLKYKFRIYVSVYEWVGERRQRVCVCVRERKRERERMRKFAWVFEDGRENAWACGIKRMYMVGFYWEREKMC